MSPAHFCSSFPKDHAAQDCESGPMTTLRNKTFFYKSFPEGSGCLQHLENGQVEVSSSTAWRSDQVYNLWAESRVSVPNISPRVALVGRDPTSGGFYKEGKMTAHRQSGPFGRISASPSCASSGRPQLRKTWGLQLGAPVKPKGWQLPLFPASLIFSGVVPTHLYWQDPPRTKTQKDDSGWLTLAWANDKCIHSMKGRVASAKDDPQSKGNVQAQALISSQWECGASISPKKGTALPVLGLQS